MNIDYTYKITSTDLLNKVMVVEYTASSLPTITVGTPMPTVDQTLESIVRNYAPIAQWEQSLQEYINVPVGTTGTITSGNESPVILPVSQFVEVPLEEI